MEAPPRKLIIANTNEELSPVSHTVGQIAKANDDGTEDAGATPLAQPVKPCMAVPSKQIPAAHRQASSCVVVRWRDIQDFVRARAVCVFRRFGKIILFMGKQIGSARVH